MDTNDMIVRRRHANAVANTHFTSQTNDTTHDTISDDHQDENKSLHHRFHAFHYYFNYYLYVGVNAIRSVIYRLTGGRSVDPTKRIINNLLQKFPFDELQSLSVEELFDKTLADNEFESALELAITYGFDCDVVYQRMWRKTPITRQTIDESLSKISKQLWILRECVECVAQDLDSMKYLLQFGLNITTCDKFVTHFYSRIQSQDKHKDGDNEATDEEVMTARDIMESEMDWNDMSLESKQVCIWRRRLLQYMDRLNVYEMVLSYRDVNDINSKYNHKFYQIFREMSSLEASVYFARNADYNAVSILLTYESADLLDHRLVILSNIDETLSPKRYTSLLPKVVSPKVKGYEVYDWNQILLREEDWVESRFPSVFTTNTTQFESEFYSENTSLLRYKSNRLSKSLLTQWYLERSRQILSLTSIVMNALDLVDIGIKHMVPNLEKLYSDLDIFALIVYESKYEEEIEFEDFENYSNKQKIDVLMSGALESDEHFLSFVEKYLKVFIAKVCKEDPKQMQTIGRELFKDYLISVAKSDLNFCLKVFENSSLSNTSIERSKQNTLIEEPSDLIEFAIDCIYASEDPNQLEVCFQIMECLPQPDMVPLIANNDINQIKRLNELNGLADKLEIYLVAAEIIEQYDCPPTISQIRDLEVTTDREGVKHLFTRITRNCAKSDKPLSVNEWMETFKSLEEVRKTCLKDCITEDQLFEVFVQTLLCSARKENFGLAAGYLQLNSETKYKKKVVPFQKTKKLLISAAQEYINSSDSANDYNIVLAKECLQLIDEREQQKDALISEELNLIESLHLIEDNFDLKLLPIQIRLIPQPRLELIEKILKSSSKAYQKTLKILKISQLLKVCSDFDSDYRNGTVLSLCANVALDSKDFKHCFNSCEQIMKNNYTVGWKARRSSDSLRFQRIAKQYLYLKDKHLVELVANHLSDDLPNDNSVIFESSPGTALLTKHLLKSGAQKVRVFEDNPIFLDKLKIINIPNLLYKDVDSGEDINSWFSGIPVRDWRSEPTIKFVSVLSPINSTLFMRFVIKQLLRKDLFFNCGRTQFLVFVSQKEYKYMSATPDSQYRTYRSISVIYNTLFDVEKLETIPYSRFGFYSDSESNRKEPKFEGNSLLVRLTPKPYLDELDGQTLQDYYYFVTQTFMKRKNWIIPFLENWFPNCGPDLIKKGIPVFKYFGDLRAEEVLDLFKYFYNRSDYNNSIYKTFATNDIFDNEFETQDIKEDDEEVDTKDKEELIDNEI
ncbi:unnamed protein product [Oppiella nova]|uniref:Sec39 domain-containing protein n=1 Tax=Oppiella nova TaxID=334625 RepID=A0A7R9QG31_9ACAR|nr:unnamed protein product [Oppiella nova]CAG2164289.1 unnamed protein product [Oppiella nova]